MGGVCGYRVKTITTIFVQEKSNFFGKKVFSCERFRIKGLFYTSYNMAISVQNSILKVNSFLTRALQCPVRPLPSARGVAPPVYLGNQWTCRKIQPAMGSPGRDLSDEVNLTSGSPVTSQVRWHAKSLTFHLMPFLRKMPRINARAAYE